MTVLLVKKVLNYAGVSTDTKPALTRAEVGSSFYETNTGRAFIWTGMVWVAGPGQSVVLDSLAHYHCNDIDDVGDPMYFGYTDKSGNWYILEYNDTNGTLRYEVGTVGYAANWTGRAGLTYGYFAAEF